MSDASKALEIEDVKPVETPLDPPADSEPELTWDPGYYVGPYTPANYGGDLSLGRGCCSYFTPSYPLT